MRRWFDSLFVAGLLLAALLSAPRVFNAGEVNFWSRQFFHASDRLPADPPAGHTRAAYWQAAALFNAGDLAGAEKHLTGRSDTLSLHLLADIFLVQRRFDEAGALWQQAGDAQALLDVASQAAQAGDLGAAEGAFEAAHRLDAEAASLALATFHFNQQCYAEAEALLRQALSDFPASPRRADWTLRLGDVLRGEERWVEAEQAYRAVIATSPENWQAHLGLGWTLDEGGAGLQAALAEFEQVTAAPASQGRGQAAIAQLMMREKRFAEAEGWFAQAIALDPQVTWWYSSRASAARQAGDLTLAFSVLQQGLALFPNSAQLYSEMALTYRQAEQRQAALDSIERALALTAAPNLSFFLRAGALYEWTGDKAKALDFYRQALSLDPQNESALSGVDRLGK